MNITNGERKLWDFESGYSGGFYDSLFKTILKADVINTEKLRKAYPEEVEACKRYQNEPGYWERLDKEVRDQKKTKGENDE